MGQWADAIKHNLPELMKQLDSPVFNGLLHYLYSVSLLSDMRGFLKSDTDSNERQQSKVREFLLHVSGNLTKDRLRVFYCGLLQVQLTGAAQLIKPYLPDSEERQVKPQTSEPEAISRSLPTQSTEPHPIRDTRQRSDDQHQPNTGKVNQIACLRSPQL